MTTPSSPLAPLRVAHVMAGAPTGGAELFFERLCMAQAASGLSVLPIIRQDAARAERMQAGGARPHALKFGGLTDWRTRPQLRTQLKQFAPRVTVAWMNRAARFTPQGDWILAGRLGGFYDLSYYRRCSHLIGNTHGLVRWMREQGWPQDRVHYLPNFATELAHTPPVRPKGVPAGVPFLLALGRLHTNKAFDVLIRAMAHLPGVWLVIAGEGPERAALEDLARKAGVADRVLMPGWATHPGGLIRACTALVCPSRHEPLGNVVIEGFSAQKPVVAAASQGPTELIRSGENGLLAPVEDDRALAQQLAAVLEDPARASALAAAGRAEYDQTFATTPVLNAWADFLSTVEAP
ncbi:glycosyltransferase [Acetobacter orleanensis]|uniref:Glycosyl transferase n=1 Tax=Acetobacter orleanensis TaxID=104099 RepID=A0A4Y3TNE2_9PROT|nr:glycosyltransferase [Acetobacter orleanensis]KXV64259.1 glycosyl transferase [Acetobacter orleanensis]PCD79040.1 glycosyltransferase [Acetobacter orleanensis]GAN69447.1 glycosyl transferase [Acetobacter orleanensis JCM 7639]GBR22590.1 glycosyltransferase [Acetobacter orleanensis NRIC 0473]GEB82949.1 glycosyl transferase [Acetobacter orleanensis]